VVTTMPPPDQPVIRALARDISQERDRRSTGADRLGRGRNRLLTEDVHNLLDLFWIGSVLSA
jgi:hypothetical protein